MVFKNLCVRVLGMIVASALEGLKYHIAVGDVDLGFSGPAYQNTLTQIQTYKHTQLCCCYSLLLGEAHLQLESGYL